MGVSLESTSVENPRLYRRGWLLTIGLALLLAGCTKPSESVYIDPALRVLVPDDTVLMVGLRVDKLQNTPAYQKYFANRQFPLAEEFTRVTGVNVKKDLWSLVLCSNGKDTVLLGRGKFSASDLEPHYEKEGVERIPYKGFKIFGNEQAAVLLINSSVAVAGTPAALKAFADAKDSKKPDVPAALSARLKDVSPDAQFWVVYAGGPVRIPVPDNSNLANVNRLLQTVQSGSLSVDFRFGIDAAAKGICGTEKEAQEVLTALRGIVGLGRLSTKETQADLLRLYDSIIIDGNSREARLKANIGSELVEKFLGQWLR